MELRNVLSYYFKNILYMLLFAIVPAVFIGLLIHPFSLIEMLVNYPTMQTFTFGQFFTSVYGSGALGILWFVLGFLIVTICISFLLGKIELHFRTGNFDISSHNARGLNNNLKDIVLVALVMLVIDFVINIIGLLLMFLVHFIFGTSADVSIVSVIINWFIGIAVILLQGVLTSLFMFVGVDKIIMGSPFTVATSNAFNCFSRHKFRQFLLNIFPFVVGIVLTVIGALVGVVWLTNIISILLLLPYICILAMMNFFEFYDMPRYDNRKYYNLK